MRTSTDCVRLFSNTRLPCFLTDKVGFLDDPELLSGMPVGVQLVGRTHQEEALLAIGEIVDSALKFEYLFGLSC